MHTHSAITFSAKLLASAERSDHGHHPHQQIEQPCSWDAGADAGGPPKQLEGIGSDRCLHTLARLSGRVRVFQQRPSTHLELGEEACAAAVDLQPTQGRWACWAASQASAGKVSLAAASCIAMESPASAHVSSFKEPAQTDTRLRHKINKAVQSLTCHGVPRLSLCCAH